MCWLLKELDGAFFFPAGVNSKGPVTIQDRYFVFTWSLKGLFKHLSKGWRTGVRPPGMTATSIFRLCKASFMDSVKWARKESQTNSDRSSVGFLDSLCFGNYFKFESEIVRCATSFWHDDGLNLNEYCHRIVKS